MDESAKHHNPNPVITANPLSRLFFWWMNPFMKKGYGKTLEVEDMYSVCPEDKSQILGDKLERAWDKEVKRRKGGKNKPRLYRALFRIYGLKYTLLICLLLIEEAIKIGQPLLLGELITYFTPNPSISSTQAYLYAAGISMCTVIVAIIHHPYFFGVTRMGMQIKIACCSLMYRKCLRLSHLGSSKTTTGQIVNLMSNDVNKIDFAVMLFPFVFTGPVVTIAAIVILWKEVGVSTLAGIAVVTLFVGIQAAMSRLFSKFREKTAKYTDKRVTIMNEIIAGIRIIKIYCWEKSFGEIIKKVRSSEIHSVRVVNYLASILETISRNGKHLCIYAVVLFLTVENRHFRASELYITVALLNALSMNVLLFLSLGVKHSIQMAVTIKRIQEFLMLEEFGEELGSVKAKTENVRTSDCFIEMRHVSAKWNETLERQTLHDISASVKPGQLLAVIGPVGAGKSSMLMAILRELPLSVGSIVVNGRLAYVSQLPWVFSASLRQNIVFGNEFKQNKYDEIVVACALDKDIAILPYGDRTLIGDRGVKLSGGQRSRISLARALYMDADIYLLDDPFSAVDANVGKHIFSNVIQGILKRKPKILVTHQLQFLHDADQIIILKEGTIIGSDTFGGLCVSGVDFTSLVKKEKKEDVETSTTSYTIDDAYHLLAQPHHNPQAKKDAPTNAYHGNKSLSYSEEASECKPGTVQMPPQEEVETGSVNWRVYFNYLKSGAGLFKIIVLVCVCVAAQVCFVASDWWLSQWSNENEERFSRIQRNLLLNRTEHTFASEAPPIIKSSHNLIIYSGIIGGVIILGLMRGLLYFKVAVDASQKLHNAMFASITRAQIGFFDTNPVGRVLNRFSKDVGLIDELLPFTAFDFLQTFLWVISYVLVAGIINPWVFIAITPLSVIFFMLRHYYLHTSRQVQRLEGITRSPVFTHISASLQGLHSIRAFGVQEKFVQEFDGHQDFHTEAWFLVIATTRWLAIILDWLCVLFIIAVSFSGVFAAKNLDAGRVGFSMTYAMAVMVVFQWMVRQSSLVENQMVSVERVLDYSKLPSEAPLETDARQKPPSDWPQQGEISTRNACLKYSDESPFILKDLTFSILPREKIGVVGRTGAGKSSMITVLTRLVESEGEIFIDSINIRNLGLHELRNSISVIPQDPVLFTGTLRRNLDPFENHKDASLWKALAEVELKQSVDVLPHGLNTEVAEGGTNFSVGQRQLICLARAILKHNKILIIDEATANVDPRTDQMIQKTIREKFHKCTVLTIAHRLYTVMDSDRLLVLNEGKIIEFDIPHLLLQNTDSFLFNLVNKMGKEAAKQLLAMAKSAYNQKNNYKAVMLESLPVSDRSDSSQENNTVVTYL